MRRQVAEKKVGAFTMSILCMVSGKHTESIAACSLTMARDRDDSCDVVNPPRSKIQKHSKLQNDREKKSRKGGRRTR
jgi:hypothetical protein